MAPETLWLTIIGGISLIGSVGIPLLLMGGQRKLNDANLADLEEQRQADDRRRGLDDDRRIRELRNEWQRSTEDLDALWHYLENEMLPWARNAYNDAVASQRPIKAPPPLPRRNGDSRTK